MYEKSYMHKDIVTHIAVVPSHPVSYVFSPVCVPTGIQTWFLCDSQSRRLHQVLEEARGGDRVCQAIQGTHGTCHWFADVDEAIADDPCGVGLYASYDGTLCASLSTDTAVKIFDVLNYDLALMLRLSFRPSCAEWISKKRGEGHPCIVLCDSDSPQVFVYDIYESTTDPIHTFSPHASPVKLLKYNAIYNTVISMDTKGKHLVGKWRRCGREMDVVEVSWITGTPQIMCFQMGSSVFS